MLGLILIKWCCGYLSTTFREKHLVTLAPTKLDEGKLSNICQVMFASFEADLSLAEMSPVDNVTF